VAVYRVGQRGATVFAPDGRVVATLEPGLVVVEGVLSAGDSLASALHAAATRPPLPDPPAGYHDKIVRPGRGPTA
jgi:hypothetical protein